MADSFGIPQVIEYLSHMGLKIAREDSIQENIEIVFHSDHGQWRMVIGIQQSGDVRKLLLIVPHMSAITTKKRLECLEALMAVNYRIALGKFGMDLDDGEVRLEETIPLANHTISFEQFQLALGALIQTLSIYHSLIPRIIYGNLSVQEALHACEQEYFYTKGSETPEQTTIEVSAQQADTPAELDVDDVLAEVTRLFEESQE